MKEGAGRKRGQEERLEGRKKKEGEREREREREEFDGRRVVFTFSIVYWHSV